MGRPAPLVAMPGLATERGTLKILIVEDDEGVTQTFARMQREWDKYAAQNGVIY